MFPLEKLCSMHTCAPTHTYGQPKNIMPSWLIPGIGIETYIEDPTANIHNIYVDKYCVQILLKYLAVIDKWHFSNHIKITLSTQKSAQYFFLACLLLKVCTMLLPVKYVSQLCFITNCNVYQRQAVHANSSLNWRFWKVSWTEPSTWWVSSSWVGLVVGKKPDPWTTHPVADLALKVAGGWCTRLA